MEINKVLDFHLGFNMAYAKERRVEVYARAQEGLAKLEKNPDKRAKYTDFIDQYASLTNEELAVYKKEYFPNNEQKEEIMGFAQMFRDEGKEEGKEEGEKKGKKKGEVRMLLRLLQSRFGDVPSWARDKMAKADLPVLEAWGIRTLEADSLDAVFKQ